MKNYNLSAIMKRAWELVKRAALTMSEALKKAWKEAKNTTLCQTVEMNVIGRETFTVDCTTGIVTGKTYHAKEFLKDNFNAKWDRDNSQWIVDTDKFANEISKYADYYKKYIVPKKTVASSELVNGYDGFYSYQTYTDGTTGRVFVG